MWKLVACCVLGVLFSGPLLIFEFSAQGQSSAPTPSAHGVTNSGTGADWASYGGTLENQRYSTLSKINRKNVSELSVAWAFQVGFSDALSSFENTPTVVNGIMYVSSPKDDIFALKADTGELLWRYDPQVNLSTTKFCCGIASRGVAVAGDKIYLITSGCASHRWIKRTANRLPVSARMAWSRSPIPSKAIVKRLPPLSMTVSCSLVWLGASTRRADFSVRMMRKPASCFGAGTLSLSGRNLGGDSWPNTGVYKIGGGTPGCRQRLMQRGSW